MPKEQTSGGWYGTIAFFLAIAAVMCVFVLTAFLFGGPSNRAAPMMQALTQARGIQSDETVWAKHHHHQYPPNLAVMFHDDFFFPSYLLAPTSQVKVPSDFDHWSAARQDAWISKHSSFVLIPGLTDHADAKTIAVFEKPGCAIDGRVAVVFNDNRARARPIAEVKALLKKQTGKTMAELIGESERRR